MKIAIATDHNGVDLKKEIIKYLETKGHEVLDISMHNSQGDDYPVYAFEVGRVVANNEATMGILICGTGIGMSIAANKVKGIRCAQVSNTSEASLTRKDNDSNIITINPNNTINNIIKLIDIFINTPASMDIRHIRRRELITKYENGEYNV